MKRFFPIAIALFALTLLGRPTPISANDPLPDNDELQYNCDVSRSGDNGSLEGTLRSRTEMYNGNEGCFCNIIFQQAFAITLGSPIELDDISRCILASGARWGTLISGMGPGPSPQPLGVEINALNLTRTDSTACAFKITSGLEAKHQIQHMTIRVSKEAQAICDETGRSIYHDPTTVPGCLSAGKDEASECEFQGITIDEEDEEPPVVDNHCPPGVDDSAGALAFFKGAVSPVRTPTQNVRVNVGTQRVLNASPTLRATPTATLRVVPAPTLRATITPTLKATPVTPTLRVNIAPMLRATITPTPKATLTPTLKAVPTAIVASRIVAKTAPPRASYSFVHGPPQFGHDDDADDDGYWDYCDPDDDNDGVCDGIDAADYGLNATCTAGPDNCQFIRNGSQEDNQANADSDAFGDICDLCPNDDQNDVDGDGRCADVDNCPTVSNATQTDSDNDGIGDACEGLEDEDEDGVSDDFDQCPGTPPGTTVLSNGCPDDDDDGVPNNLDQCPGTPADTEVLTDGCPPTTADIDEDDDGVQDTLDDCPGTPAGTVVLSNGCPDTDDDGVPDNLDLCPGTPAATEVLTNGCPPTTVDIDEDDDGVQDTLDDCPGTPAGTVVLSNGCPDSDDDGVPDNLDLCPGTPPVTIVFTDGCPPIPPADADGDGVPDTLDQCPGTPAGVVVLVNGCQPTLDDTDGDGILDAFDLCLPIPSTQSDVDGDRIGDECDPNADGDSRLNADDNCPFVPNDDQRDTDGDGIGDVCEGSAFTTDTDGDGVFDFFDCAPQDSTRVTILECYGDRDGDGLSDVQEEQRQTDPDDADTDDDGVMDPLDCNPIEPAIGAPPSTCLGVVRVDDDPDLDEVGLGDNCPFISNADQADSDRDGVGDACDIYPDFVAIDTDGDGVLDPEDNCPIVPNPSQADRDGDGVGDRCQGDRDGDGILDQGDNCPSHFNTNQSDLDQDGRGDPCDEDFVPSLSPLEGTGGCTLIPS